MQLAPNQVLDVGFKFVPEIALGESQEILSGQTPEVRMIRRIFSPREACVDDRRAAKRRSDIGKSDVVTAWCLYHQSADQRVPRALPHVAAERGTIAQVFVQRGRGSTL